jgi:NAD(P)-dependent dehydrogenase (short-subunit alcohol dehydrogenase family)
VEVGRLPRGTDRICLITGATSGIGRATAHALAEIGATTVLVARDPPRGEATAEEIRRATGNDRIEVLIADLSSQASIRELAGAFRREHDRLDVLVNCAGAFFRERRVTVDGLEMMFALNHLAYFLLTNLLLDLLRRSGSARVLNVTAPATTKIDFDDLQGERRYRPFTAFGASKVANLMFTFELARRLEGTGIMANAVHPGRVRSDIMREAPAPFRLLTRLVSGSPERAGAAIAHLATSSLFAGKTGRFYRDGKEIRPPEYAMSVEVQRRLWDASDRLTGTHLESR